MTPIQPLPFKFPKLAEAILLGLNRHPELFGRHTYRTREGSPHEATKDIYFRGWADPPSHRPEPLPEGWSLGDCHDSEWLKPVSFVPEVREATQLLAFHTGASRIGTVLCTRLPPGKRIEAHIDQGWHARYYEKYHLAIQTPPESFFGFESAQGFDAVDFRTEPGDVSWFRNDISHWVTNDSPYPRISLIVCLSHR